jgi:DNA-binding transcriptional ArsR family regulator
MTMASGSPLPDTLVDLIAQRFRALGEPSRIRILECLRDRPRTVQELAQALEFTQQNVSKHLGLLLSLGIVSRRKEGGFSYYSIEDESVLRMCDEVCGALQRHIAELHELIGEGARP